MNGDHPDAGPPDDRAENATGVRPRGDAADAEAPTALRRSRVETATRSRRRFLGAVAATAAAVAGCSAGAPPDESREYRADPVWLRSASRDGLALAETLRDELRHEHTRTVGDDRVRVRLQNRGAAYERTRDDPALLESYVDAATTRSVGGAVVVPASRLGLGADAMAAGLWSGWDVPVERVGLLVPEGARSDGEVELDETMAVASGDAAGLASVEVGSSVGVGVFADAAAVLPDELYVPGEFHVLDEFYVPDGFTTPDGFDAGGVLYVDTEQRATRLFDRADLPGDAVAGGSVDLANVMLAAPGDAVLDHPDGFDPEAVFDLGDPAPLAGREFGVAGLSTPRATIDGVSVTPLVDADRHELLEHDHARALLGEAGVTNATDVEWLRGPTPVEPGWHDLPGVALLGETVEVTAYAGVLAGATGPRAVVVYAADVHDGDRVLGFAAAARPVGSPDGRDALVGEDGFFDQERFARAGEAAAAALPELVHGDPDAQDSLS